MSEITNLASADDHLFFFVIDHGGSIDHVSNSYICLWGNERLQDTSLGSMIERLTNKQVTVNMVLGQCYSGGFIDNLNFPGCVVSTACTGSESSWACKEIPFDEFVYQWTCAINSSTPTGLRIEADDDGNNNITMKEAFDYAKAHDSTNETPQYFSMPESVGEDLAFNHLVPSYDLYIKDNYDDTGKEPNLTTNIFLDSPSIWVRNQPDSIEQPENPQYSPDHILAYIYVKIHNRGKSDYNSGKYIHLYWATASTSIAQETWKGRETYNEMYPTGDHIPSIGIPNIKAGDSLVIQIPWQLPYMMGDPQYQNRHFCLVAKIMDTPYDDDFHEGHTYFDIKGKNDHAQRNVTIIRNTDLDDPFGVFVRNPTDTAQCYSLEMIPRTSSDIELFNMASISMEMSNTISAAWESGGMLSTDIDLAESASNGGCYTVIFNSPNSVVKNISLAPKEFDEVLMRFDFHTGANVDKIFTFDLIQKDADGNIVGGETFMIEPPLNYFVDSVLIDIDSGFDGVVLTAKSPRIIKTRWADKSGAIIGTSKSIKVYPNIHNDVFRLIALTDSGELINKSVSLKSAYGIKSISPTLSANSTLSVKLQNAAIESSTLIVSSTLDGLQKMTTNVPAGATDVTIDVSGLDSGLYVISYVANDVIIDSRKFTKQ